MGAGKGYQDIHGFGQPILQGETGRAFLVSAIRIKTQKR